MKLKSISQKTVYVVLIATLLVCNGCHQTCEDDISEAFHGKIILKKHSRRNHDSRDIKLQGVDGRDTWMNVAPIDMKLWDMLLVGDSIYKRQNTHNMFIKRGNRVYPYELQCKSRFR